MADEAVKRAQVPVMGERFGAGKRAGRGVFAPTPVQLEVGRELAVEEVVALLEVRVVGREELREQPASFQPNTKAIAGSVPE